MKAEARKTEWWWKNNMFFLQESTEKWNELFTYE